MSSCLSTSLGFPPPTLPIEFKLQEIVEDFLHTYQLEGNEKLKALPFDIRTSLHKAFYEASSDKSKFEDSRFGERIEAMEVSSSLKAAIITHFARTHLFEDDLARATEELYELNRQSDLIDYPTHSQEGRKTETRSLTHAELYPYDATRVLLSDDTYINANHILEKYILTQCPMEGTVNPFWQMVDETKAHTIVMLNGEEGLPYLPYFPHSLGESVSFKGRSITLIKDETSLLKSLGVRVQTVSDRTFIFKDLSGERHIIHHLKANHWHDFTAGDPETVEKLISLVRIYQEKEGSAAPTIIHCRGGVGRAGQFTLSLHLEEAIREGKPYNLRDTLATLRDPRTGRCPQMVQSLPQYLNVTRFLKNLKAPSLS
jgi:protein tyrosine phosphatase